jgi:hypothetical protein
MPSCSADEAERAPGDDPAADALLVLNRDKSPRAGACPAPRLDRAAEIIDFETGEVTLKPVGCGRNGCLVCRRRNVQQTAAKMGIAQSLSDRPVTHAVLSTTRDWVETDTLREGWRQMSRGARRHILGEAPRYSWFREWSVKPIAGTELRRTHYHSTWALENDDQAQAMVELSIDVWGRLAGAYSEHAHGAQRIWDAGGLTRYLAGLVGHHLKEGQAPPPGWTGRRFGTSLGFYPIDSLELDRQAKAVVSDDRMLWHLEQAMARDDAIPDRLPVEIWDELLTALLEEARSRPPVRVVRVDPSTWAR